MFRQFRIKGSYGVIGVGGSMIHTLGVMREDILSIISNIQVAQDKRFIWGHRGRRLINIHIDTSKTYSYKGP